jgi:hypothetical protein
MAALGLTCAAYADTLVVRASGPSAKSYPAGRKLPDGGSVVLKAGDVVTLLDAKGTRTLRGPGSFGVTASSAQVSGAPLTALLDTKRVRRARTGAVRGTIGEAAAVLRRPNLWLVDVAQPGAICFADPAAVRLWRGDAAKAATARISGGGKQASVAFAAGESIAAWPAALPVTVGAAYRIEGVKPVEVRFAGVGLVEQGLDKVADGLIAKGCDAQLDLLVDTAAAK